MSVLRKICQLALIGTFWLLAACASYETTQEVTTPATTAQNGQEISAQKVKRTETWNLFKANVYVWNNTSQSSRCGALYECPPYYDRSLVLTPNECGPIPPGYSRCVEVIESDGRGGYRYNWQYVQCGSYLLKYDVLRGATTPRLTASADFHELELPTKGAHVLTREPLCAFSFVFLGGEGRVEGSYMFEEIRCKIEGRVQLVMFRDFTQRKARGLEICGWVKNLPDGTVDVVAQGSPDALKAFIEKLHEGSILSRVDSVSVEWRAPTETFDDFRIVYV